MGCSHTQVWQIKLGRDISAAEIPPEEPGVPVPYQAPPALDSSVRKRSFHKFWL